MNGLDFTLNPGTHKVLDFQLEEGTTNVYTGPMSQMATCDAAVIIYQEGARSSGCICS